MADQDITKTPEYHMYAFKILSCPLKTSHDWSSCSWAHPKEQARRRDPRRYYYTPVMCPYAKMGAFACPKGDACDMAHQIYEYWLHPLKFRSELCRKGPLCDRRLCFFAHRPEELRSPTQEQLVATGMMAPPPGVAGARPSGAPGVLPPMLEDAPAGGEDEACGLPANWEEEHAALLAAVGAGGSGAGGACMGGASGASGPLMAQLAGMGAGADGLAPPTSMGDVMMGTGGAGGGGDAGVMGLGDPQHMGPLGTRAAMLMLQHQAPLQHASSMDTHSTFSSSSALMQIGGSGSFTHGPGHSMGGGSFTTPSHGMGGGSFSQVSQGMGGGSFTYGPGHSMGGGSFTAPSHGMGGGSFSQVSHGMGGNSFTMPTHGSCPGSFTHPSPGMGGGSFTHPSPGMGGGSFSHPPLQSMVQRQLSLGASTPPYTVLPPLQLQQAAQQAAQAQQQQQQQHQQALNAQLVMLPSGQQAQYSVGAGATAGLRTSSFTSDTSSVASADAGAAAASAGKSSGPGASAPLPSSRVASLPPGIDSLSAPLTVMGDGGLGLSSPQGQDSSAGLAGRVGSMPCRSGSFQLRALTAQLQELTDAAEAAAGTGGASGAAGAQPAGQGGAAGAGAASSGRGAPRLHVVRALAAALKNELSALAAGVGGSIRGASPSPGGDASGHGRAPSA